ncbi:MAG TPA: hypothetical protein VI199_14835 [Novosphingobium sp.]
MKQALALGAVLLACAAAPARAEKLDIDHRLYSPLHAVMENATDGTVYYDASQPGRVFDRIMVRGSSAERDWTEALEILVIRRAAQFKTAQDWLATFRPDSESACPARLSSLAADDSSMTFALDAPACASGPALTGLYRVVLGRKSIYVVSAKLKGAMTPSQREQWLALLGSAKLSG